MNQHHMHDPYDSIPKEQSSFEKKHLWRMRWAALAAYILIFVGSLVIIAITKNSLLISLPSSILLAMRPIIRFIFPQERCNEKGTTHPSTSEEQKH